MATGGLGGLGGADFDLLARTIIGEAGNQPLDGRAAVGHVVMNRLKSGKYGGTLQDVLFAPKQFEPWNTRRDELLSIPTSSPKYQEALDIAKAVGRGLVPDVTGGATHFANVGVVQQRGNTAGMSWINQMLANGTAKRIGAHTFGNPDSEPGANGGRVRLASNDPNFVPAARGAGAGALDTIAANEAAAPTAATGETMDGTNNGGLGGLGGMLSAIGMTLLSSPRNNPFQGLPQHVQAMAEAQARQKLLEYNMAKDNRSFGLQERQLANSEQNTVADNRRADEQLGISRATLEETRLGEIGKKMRLFHPDLKPGTPEYMEAYKKVAQVGGTYSKSPVYGTDANGNPVILQLGETGETKQATLPPGVTLSKDPIKIDAGTETILIDPVTRQPVGRIPKNVAETASQGAQGKEQGAAIAGAPSALASAEQTVKLIDNIKAHPGREWGTGMSSFLPSVPGTDMKDFRVKLDQLKGRTFLEAFSQLKGGGAISEVEGKKAEAAIAALDAAQSEKQFMESLDELRGIVESGMERLRQKTRGGSAAPSASAPSAAPTGGRLRFDANGNPM